MRRGLVTELARRRARLRAESAGGVLFVVAMTLAVLASLGVYALQAASNELTTSGHTRQQLQTHYLAEYGALGVTWDVGVNTKQYLVDMKANPDTGCWSLYGTGAAASDMSKGCISRDSSQIGPQWQNNPPVKPYGGTPATPGSLGPIPVDGDFRVEVTDRSQSPPLPGFGTSTNSSPMCFYYFTVTATGITKPKIVGNDTAFYGGQGREQSRVRITAGPALCEGGSQ